MCAGFLSLHAMLSCIVIAASFKYTLHRSIANFSLIYLMAKKEKNYKNTLRHD